MVSLPLSRRNREAYVPGDAVQHRQEKALLALDVVLFHVGLLEFKVHGHAVGGFVGVVGKVLAGLDVVLVVVGPVEIDFLAVYRGWRSVPSSRSGAWR